MIGHHSGVSVSEYLQGFDEIFLAATKLAGREFVTIAEFLAFVRSQKFMPHVLALRAMAVVL